MSRSLSPLSLSVLLFWCFPSLASFHVLIDPGHGGIDQGAVHRGLKEADVVLDVAQRLEKLLRDNPGLRVSLTRTDNRSVALPERAKMAEKVGADLFISLHANSAPDSRARGVELFFQNSLPPDEEAQFLANLENQNAGIEGHNEDSTSMSGDLSAIVEDLHRQHRLRASLTLSETMSVQWDKEQLRRGASIKQAPLYVVSKTSMPAVLVELGFLTNPAEAKKLATPAYRQDLAQKLREAVLNYRARLGHAIQNETVSK